MSSFFDIQARLYQIKGNDLRSKDLPGNLSYLIDVYRPLTTLILDDRLQAVEGLVIDTQHPKIGFRNHTAPINVQYGAEWDEDLLFLEPETKCIDLNISVLFFLNEPYVYKLVDKGGFVNMNITSPWKAQIGKDIWYDDIQESPALDWRAQATGWSVNFLLAHYFNIIEPKKPKKHINSWLGREFPAIIDMAGGFAWDNQIDLINDYSLLGKMDDGHNSSFNIVPANFTALRAQCDGSDVGVNVGVDKDDSRQHDAYKVKANIANIQIKCGLVMGTAHPTSGDNSLISKDLDSQERPIYSCASTTKAVIKTVRFRYNSTKSDRESMNGLEILNIVDKVYNSRNERPLWGVEDVNMSIPHINPLWGLIGASWGKSVNLSTVRAERLYLPAGRSLLTNVNFYEPAENNDFHDNFSSLGDFTPAITGPGQAWRFVYKSKQSRRNKLPDYSGSESLTLSNKWDHLSHTAEGAAQILNLIFTDYTANMLTGTRSQLTINNLPLSEQKAITSRSEKKNKSEPGQVSVHLYHRIIRYRWVYGIPAFLSLLLVALIVVGAGVALLTNQGSIKRVKHYLWNLSAGRILTSFIYPRSGHMQSATKEWIRAVGAKNITITHGDPPRAGSPDIEVEVDSRRISTTTSFGMVTQDEREELVPNDAPLDLRSISRSGRTFMNHEESTTASTQSSDIMRLVPQQRSESNEMR